MKTIWKYELHLGSVNRIVMPGDADVLCVQPQDGKICLWALVDPANEAVTRRFMVYGTGHDIKDDVDGCYLGTVQTPPFVWHVFEE